jgi:tRNA-dihydrouridine synthase
MSRKRKLTKREMAALDALVGKSKPGIVTAPDVVNAARNKNHPLHDRFEWNVKRAAYQHWLEQARDIVQVYAIVINGDTTPVHAFVSMSQSTGEDGYMPIRSALASADTMRALRKAMAETIRSTLKRYEYLRPKLAAEFRIIESAARRIEKA